MFRGHGVGRCCDLWQHDSPPACEPTVIAQAMSGHTATMLNSIRAIATATPVLITGVDAKWRELLAKTFTPLHFIVKRMQKLRAHQLRITITSIYKVLPAQFKRKASSAPGRCGER